MAEQATSQNSNQPTTIGGSGIADQTADRAHDKLGFEPYVAAVCTFLLHNDTQPPFTLSIEGDWGSGKSSFMYQLSESLELADNKAVWFNAWRHDKIESMWAAFALHFTEDLSYRLPWHKRLFINFKINWQRFDLSKGWFSLFKTILQFAFYGYIIYLLAHILTENNISKIVPKDDKLDLSFVLTSLGWSGVVITGLLILMKIAEYAGNPLKNDLQKYIVKPNYEGNSSFIEQFSVDFGKTVEALSEGKSKLFVFIDDLDRAEIPKAAELMQGLNMMISGSQKLVFIIGMDREKVAAGVSAKYKELLPFLNPNQAQLNTAEGLLQARLFGYNFLEKFIQLSFSIPKPSRASIKDFVRSLGSKKTGGAAGSDPILFTPVLTIADGDDSDDFRDVTILVASFFEYNPRRLKQFANSFRLKAYIANATGLFNTDQPTGCKVLTIPQLGKFIALIMIWPNMVDYLTDDPGLLPYLASGATENAGRDVWKTDNKLMALINAGPGNSTTPKQTDENYSLEFINVAALIETSPSYKISADPVTRAQAPASANTVFQGGGIEFEENSYSGPPTSSESLRDKNPIPTSPRNARYK